jgi:hypothetical protein
MDFYLYVYIQHKFAAIFLCSPSLAKACLCLDFESPGHLLFGEGQGVAAANALPDGAGGPVSTGLSGLSGLGSVWVRFTKCDFGRKNAKKPVWTGLGRFTVGKGGNRTGRRFRLWRASREEWLWGAARRESRPTKRSHRFDLARFCPPYFYGTGKMSGVAATTPYQVNVI